MASTYSNLKIQLMATGENSGTWGTVTNTNLGTALEQAITGSANVAVNANTTLSLTDTNAAQDARALRLNLSGAGGFNLTVPDIQKLYLVNNGSLGTVTVKNSTGATIAVPAAKTMWVYSTGTAVVDAVTHLTSLTLGSALPIASGGTGTTSTTYANLQTNVTGTLPVANGGTGSTTATFSGANITSLNASAISTGTLSNDRTTATASNGASTIVARDVSGNFTANVITANGSALTSLNASSISSGTVATARLASGTANSSTYLRGDQTWATVSGGTVIPAGTVMIFGQTSAPTGFTKLTDQNNAALRVVSGSASTGGSVDFTTAFASQTPTGSVSITAVSGSAGATTLSTPQIPSHSHTLTFRNPGGGNQSPTLNIYPEGPQASTNATGGGGSHTHPFSFSSGSGTFSGKAINLAVKYVGVIRATKD